MSLVVESRPPIKSTSSSKSQSLGRSRDRSLSTASTASYATFTTTDDDAGFMTPEGGTPELPDVDDHAGGPPAPSSGGSRSRSGSASGSGSVREADESEGTPKMSSSETDVKRQRMANVSAPLATGSYFDIGLQTNSTGQAFRQAPSPIRGNSILPGLNISLDGLTSPTKALSATAVAAENSPLSTHSTSSSSSTSTALFPRSSSQQSREDVSPLAESSSGSGSLRSSRANSIDTVRPKRESISSFASRPSADLDLDLEPELASPQAFNQAHRKSLSSSRSSGSFIGAGSPSSSRRSFLSGDNRNDVRKARGKESIPSLDDLDDQLAALGIYPEEGSSGNDDIDDDRRISSEEDDYDLESLAAEDNDYYLSDGADEEMLTHGRESLDDMASGSLGSRTPMMKRSRKGKRGRTRTLSGSGTQDEDLDHRSRKGFRGIFEMLSPLTLAHPLAILPLLPLLPYSFLPAGIVFFIPALVVIAGLSACASVVVIYISRYLKAYSFESIAHRLAGKYGLWSARVVVQIGMIGVTVGWLSSVHPILLPVIQGIFPPSKFLESRLLTTFLASLSLMPPIISVRHNHAALNRIPNFIFLLAPLVIFLVIGRTVEVVKSPLAPQYIQGDGRLESRIGALPPAPERRQSQEPQQSISAGTALLLLLFLFSPQPHTLPLQSSLRREDRAKFPLLSLGVAGSIVILGLPFALVPYYLLPLKELPNFDFSPIAVNRAGILDSLTTEYKDDWLNLARVTMAVLIILSARLWIEHGRGSALKALGVEHEGRAKAVRWIGMAIWACVFGCAAVGGWIAEKIELIGVASVIAIGWLVPALFFIHSFHISSPLAIVWPSSVPTSTPNIPNHVGEHGPADVLLARKERQLQKKRLGRRLWQDLIVLVGILPLGGFAVVWAAGMVFGFWR